MITHVNFTPYVSKDVPDGWNDFLLKTNTGTIFHTPEYAQYASKWIGWKPMFFRLLDPKGNIVLQNLFLEYYPGINRLPNMFHSIYKKLNASIRWSYGPVSISKEAISDFFSYVRSSKKNFYGITHPLFKITENDISKERWSTFLIDLVRPKEELYDNIEKHSAQKNIERSIERNVVVEEITDKSIKEYHDLLNDFKITNGGTRSNFEETYDFWKILKTVGFTGFLARKDNLPVAGLLFSFFNGYINEWGVARSHVDTEQRLYSQDLIKWKIIEWGINNKMSWYDLSGFNPSPASEKERGILRYKKKWGGKQYDYWIVRR